MKHIGYWLSLLALMFVLGFCLFTDRDILAGLVLIAVVAMMVWQRQLTS